ncbi:hypothetical protein V1524DRAFT_449704 [Lipomyces starkeyi]
MSVWVAAVVAKGYQYEAELDPFRSWWIWYCKKRLPNELCKCDIMGYPAPPLPTDESSHEGFAFQRLDLPMALSWLPINLGYEERELLDHFICTASSTLAIFEPDKNEFLSLLVRLALLDSSPSSMAVLQSALALSSFHRHGLQADVFRFKARALRTLITSCTPCIESPTVVQHIAANMILCHLEMLGIPNAVSLWFCHLSEAKYLIDNAGFDSQYFQREFSGLLGWVEYHMVMSRFSIRHWYINEEPIKGIKNSVKDVSYCSHAILRCLYIMFEMIRQPTDILYHNNEYENSLRCLESRITNIVPLAPEGISDTMSGLSTAWVATIELFKLAALIYLKRASRGHEQKMKILEHIERAMKTSSLSSLHGLQNILQQIWVQDDLAVDYELDYVNRLDAVITSYRIMPSFV